MNANGTADSNLFSFYETSNGQRIDWRDRDVGLDRPKWVTPYTDALKFTSQITDFQGQFGAVFAGTENCADLNNGAARVKLTADLWVANGGLYPFTIKGGSHGIGIYGKLQGHGTECDVDAGNWSDQNHDFVTDWELGLIPTDGKPITVRCMAADKPRLVPGTGPYKFLFPDPDAWYHCLIVAAFQQAHRSGLFS